jgi:phosphocarrier protein
MSEISENENQAELRTFTLEVSNKMGVHARPAAMIVRITSRYEGEIWITKEDEKINAKSIMGIMMLAAAKGTPLEFEAQCVNASEFETEMTELFASKFQDE